jgi:aspartate/glutamate racemase
MPPEFPPGAELVTCLAEGAMDALNRGDDAGHDERVVEAAHWLAGQGCDVIALAQFSMARAQRAVHKGTGLPVLTTPGSAVRVLRQRLGA